MNDAAMAPPGVMPSQQETSLDFMKDKAATSIEFNETRETFAVSRTHAIKLPVSVGFRGSNRAVSDV